MKNYRVLLAALLILLFACKSKKKEPKEKYISILSFIRSQVAHVDTSLYSIKKIVTLDSLHSDTSFIKREEFRALAKDFFELPDISQEEFRDRFTEENLFDETTNRGIISYKPKDPDKEEIQKEEALISKSGGAGDMFSNFIIEKVVSDRNGYLQKNMLWNVNRSFQVTTITQKPGEPEVARTIKVSWNEKEDE